MTRKRRGHQRISSRIRQIGWLIWTQTEALSELPTWLCSWRLSHVSVHWLEQSMETRTFPWLILASIQIQVTLKTHNWFLVTKSCRINYTLKRDCCIPRQVIEDNQNETTTTGSARDQWNHNFISKIDCLSLQWVRSVNVLDLVTNNDSVTSLLPLYQIYQY